MVTDFCVQTELLHLEEDNVVDDGNSFYIKQAMNEANDTRESIFVYEDEVQKVDDRNGKITTNS